METTMSTLSWIVIGLIAGWLAGVIVKGSGFGLIGDIAVGMVGGVVGGWLATPLLHINPGVNGISPESILVAFFGAVVFIVILRLVGGERRETIN